jgi:glucan phosphoethanolaminetransferase (alkaline phosphatase superfamily)
MDVDRRVGTGQRDCWGARGMFEVATVTFQFTWWLGFILVLAVVAGWQARRNWNVSRWRSVSLWLVAALLVLFTVSRMITHGVSSSGTGL